MEVLDAAINPDAAHTEASEDSNKVMRTIPYVALDLDILLPGYYLSQPVDKKGLVPLTELVSVIRPTKEHLQKVLAFDPKGLTDKFADAKSSCKMRRAWTRNKIELQNW